MMWLFYVQVWFEEVKGQPEMFLEQEIKSSPVVQAAPRKKVAASPSKEATVDEYRLKLQSLCKKGKAQGQFSM